MNLVVGNGIAIQAAGRPLLIAVALGFAVVAVWRLVGVDLDRSGVFGVLLLAGLLYSRDLMLPAVLLVAIGALTVEAHASRVRGSVVPWPRVTSAMNAIAAVLVATQLVRPALDAVGARHPRFDAAWQQPAAPTSTPDMFFILLDGHGRPDVLRDSFAYDPIGFVQALEGMGFTVLPSSQSNYMTTTLSIASMLAGSHVDDLGQPMDELPSSMLMYQAIAQSPSLDLVRRQGYETVAISSGYEGVSLRTADRFIDDVALNEVELTLLATTSLRPLVVAIDPGLPRNQRRARALDTFAILPDLAREPHSKPLFVFAHVAFPHSPYVFGPNCEARDVIDIEGPPLVGLTADQTRCVDSLTLAALSPLTAADPGAVVVVFSDHGPDARLDWDNPSPAALRERFANLMAIRAPGISGLFAPDATLVNTLPTIFNAYLGTHLPLRSDEQYVGGFGDAPLTHRARDGLASPIP